MNNLPMAIMLSQVMKSPIFQMRLSSRVIKGSLFALVLGSNFGGNVMIQASVAGLMWNELIFVKGIRVGFLRFTAYGVLAVIPVLAAGAAVLYLEIALFA